MEKVDFRIISKPVAISFCCPHCGFTQEIAWGELVVPDYWGEVECPECNKTVELGDYEYD